MKQPVHAQPATTSAYLDAFFDQLEAQGVRDVVVSPGSRSTPLAMSAYKHFGDVYIDVDERGAAFFALGLAKAKGVPVAVVCTSGTAVANWMPAVLEAESSRVPLLLLSADRPPRLQNIGAAQTCDQKHLFGTHVRRFYQMPLPADDVDTIAYVRQVALDACVAASGQVPGAASSDAAPVHLNFPFDEPLMVDMKGTFTAPENPLPGHITPGHILYAHDAQAIADHLKDANVLALCGEGICSSDEDAQALVQFAHAYHIPLLADPLSGLRAYDDPYIIDAYDAAYRASVAPDGVQAFIRFGRWPVSKAMRLAMGQVGIHHIVVDVRDTRDATATTDTFVHTTPAGFVRSMLQIASDGPQAASAAFAQAWIQCNAAARDQINEVEATGPEYFEGSYINRMLSLIPQHSLLFSANSMAIRALDTFMTAPRCITVMANRGLAGIDGTLSTAFGAAHGFDQTTALVGDLSFLHDANALALQHEFALRAERSGSDAPAVVVVLLNNKGGAIFDILPQKSDDDYFERLFLTPQEVQVQQLCQAFNVDYTAVDTVDDFAQAYTSYLGVPGIHVVEINLPLHGVTDRYAPYWGTALKA